MSERYHQTVKVDRYSSDYIREREIWVDRSIEYALGLIRTREKKTQVCLVSVHVFEMETQALPPRKETFVTIIAEPS